jgi:glycosyltransferase involved in cell wall biosynthesis
MRPIVRKIVRNEHPDIVALMGAENAYISGTILGLEKEFPIIFKAQTIYNNPDRGKHGIVDSKNAYVERLIFDAIPYASVTTKMHYKLYRQFNTTSYNFPWSFATTFPECNEQVSKQYDFVNFAASMSDAKGYADAIKALALVKKHYQNVVLNLVGSAAPEIIKRYHELVSEYGLEKNVIFTPSFEKQEDVFKHIRKSRFAVLPYKLDYISSTTYQVMHYELPVICYQTEGTPTLNKEKECILIAEMNNVEMLAEKMCLLLSNKEKQDLLRKNAKELVDKKNDGKRISDEIIAGFEAIVNHFNTGEKINSHLICNPLKHDN